MHSKVSMVIPCFNKEDYIGDMLDSVLAQKWNDLEVILVNDGSTDGTRNVIEQYMSKLLSRGFDAILIDQENHGVAAAVKNGLMRVTGEYVCFPDCDDLLHPEYVLALLDALEQFPEADCAVCDDVRNRWNTGGPFLKQAGEKGILLQNTESLIPQWILGKIVPSVCVMMIRSSVIREVSVVEHFITDISTTQEPQIWLPLLTAGKTICYIERPLYKNIARAGSIITSQMTEERIHHYAETRRELIKAVLKINVTSDGKLEHYYELADIAFFDLVARRLSQVSGWEDSQKENDRAFIASVNHTGLLPVPLDEAAVQRVGFRIAYQAVSNYLTGYALKEKGTLELIADTQGRLIAYGAGTVARQIFSSFLQCHITPHAIWDQKGSDGEKFLDIPIAIPDFTSLTRDDTVILLLNGTRDLERELESYGARVIYYQEVLNALSIKYFPELVVVKHE